MPTKILPEDAHKTYLTQLKPKGYVAKKGVKPTENSVEVAKIINQMAHKIKTPEVTPPAVTIPTEKAYSDRFYDQYVPFDEIVRLGLDNRRGEAHQPLMNLMKREMNLDIESVMLSDMVALLRDLYPAKTDQEIQAIIDNAAKLSKSGEPADIVKTVIREKIVRSRGAFDGVQKRFRSLNLKHIISREEGLKCALDAGNLLSKKDRDRVLSKYLGKDVSKLSEKALKDELNKIKSGRRWLSLAKYYLEAFDQEPSDGLKRYFNTVNDSYAELILESYLARPDRKETVAKTIEEWTIRKTAKQVREAIHRKYSYLNQAGMDRFEENLIECFRKKDTPEFEDALRLVVHDKMTSAPDVQRTFTDILMTQFKGEKKKQIFSKENMKDPKFLDEVRSRLNNLLMETLKEAQCHEIHQYDGLIEHYTPATIRGLHDVDDEVVRKLALEGDYASVYDIFNHEVSSGARKSLYSRGHTGPSNRSTSLNFNIASYFATAHGMSSGTPKNVWFMIYEPQEALYMPDIEAAGDWKEAEIVMPHLGAKRFLGAVKFEVDLDKTNETSISLRPVDGFLSDKAKKGEFDGTGIVGEIKQVFDTAKNFSEGNVAELSNLSVIRRPQTPESWMSKAKKIDQWQKIADFKQEISKYPNRYVAAVLPKTEMPSDQTAYLAERAKQRALVDLETDLQRLARLEKERQRQQDLITQYWKDHTVTSLTT